MSGGKGKQKFRGVCKEKTRWNDYTDEGKENYKQEIGENKRKEKRGRYEWREREANRQRSKKEAVESYEKNGYRQQER